MWLSTVQRVLIAEHRVDFRKGFDGLLAEAYKLGADPYAGDCIIFIKGDHTQVRAIAGDTIGLYLLFRRFDGGRLLTSFAFASDPRAKTITQAELMLLLEGASYSVHKRVKAWR